jgi:hypothetical protein
MAFFSEFCFLFAILKAMKSKKPLIFIFLLAGIFLSSSAQAFFCLNFFGKSRANHRPPIMSRINSFPLPNSQLPPYSYNGFQPPPGYIQPLPSPHPGFNLQPRLQTQHASTTPVVAQATSHPQGSYPYLQPVAPLYPAIAPPGRSNSRFCFFN